MVVNLQPLHCTGEVWPLKLVAEGMTLEGAEDAETAIAAAGPR